MKKILALMLTIFVSVNAVASKSDDVFMLYSSQGQLLSTSQLFDGAVIEFPVHPEEAQQLVSQLKSGEQVTIGEEFQKMAGAIGSVGAASFDVRVTKEMANKVSVSKHLNPIYGSEANKGRAMWISPVIAVLHPTPVEATISIRRSLISSKSYKVYFRPVLQLSSPPLAPAIGGSLEASGTGKVDGKATETEFVFALEFENKDENGLNLHSISKSGRMLSPKILLGEQSFDVEHLRHRGLGLYYTVVSRDGLPASPQNKPALGSQGQVFAGELGSGAHIEGVVSLVEADPSSPNHGALLAQTAFKVLVLP